MYFSLGRCPVPSSSSISPESDIQESDCPGSVPLALVSCEQWSFVPKVTDIVTATEGWKAEPQQVTGTPDELEDFLQVEKERDSSILIGRCPQSPSLLCTLPFVVVTARRVSGRAHP